MFRGQPFSASSGSGAFPKQNQGTIFTSTYHASPTTGSHSLTKPIMTPLKKPGLKPLPKPGGKSLKPLPIRRPAKSNAFPQQEAELTVDTSSWYDETVLTAGAQKRMYGDDSQLEESQETVIPQEASVPEEMDVPKSLEVVEPPEEEKVTEEVAEDETALTASTALQLNPPMTSKVAERKGELRCAPKESTFVMPSEYLAAKGINIGGSDFTENRIPTGGSKGKYIGSAKSDRSGGAGQVAIALLQKAGLIKSAPPGTPGNRSSTVSVEGTPSKGELQIKKPEKPSDNFVESIEPPSDDTNQEDVSNEPVTEESAGNSLEENVEGDVVNQEAITKNMAVPDPALGVPLIHGLPIPNALLQRPPIRGMMPVPPFMPGLVPPFLRGPLPRGVFLPGVPPHLLLQRPPPANLLAHSQSGDGDGDELTPQDLLMQSMVDGALMQGNPLGGLFPRGPVPGGLFPHPNPLGLLRGPPPNLRFPGLPTSGALLRGIRPGGIPIPPPNGFPEGKASMIAANTDVTRPPPPAIPVSIPSTSEAPTTVPVSSEVSTQNTKPVQQPPSSVTAGTPKALVPTSISISDDMLKSFKLALKATSGPAHPPAIATKSKVSQPNEIKEGTSDLTPKPAKTKKVLLPTPPMPPTVVLGKKRPLLDTPPMAPGPLNMRFPQTGHNVPSFEQGPKGFTGGGNFHHWDEPVDGASGGSEPKRQRPSRWDSAFEGWCQATSKSKYKWSKDSLKDQSSLQSGSTEPASGQGVNVKPTETSTSSSVKSMDTKASDGGLDEGEIVSGQNTPEAGERSPSPGELVIIDDLYVEKIPEKKSAVAGKIHTGIGPAGDTVSQNTSSAGRKSDTKKPSTVGPAGDEKKLPRKNSFPFVPIGPMYKKAIAQQQSQKGTSGGGSTNVKSAGVDKSKEQSEHSGPRHMGYKGASGGHNKGQKGASENVNQNKGNVPLETGRTKAPAYRETPGPGRKPVWHRDEDEAYKPWITKDLMKQFRERNAMERAWKAHPRHPTLRLEYVKKRNQVNAMLKRAKTEYFADKKKSDAEGQLPSPDSAVKTGGEGAPVRTGIAKYPAPARLEWQHVRGGEPLKKEDRKSSEEAQEKSGGGLPFRATFFGISMDMLQKPTDSKEEIGVAEAEEEGTGSGLPERSIFSGVPRNMMPSGATPKSSETIQAQSTSTGENTASTAKGTQAKPGGTAKVTPAKGTSTNAKNTPVKAASAATSAGNAEAGSCKGSSVANTGKSPSASAAPAAGGLIGPVGPATPAAAGAKMDNKSTASHTTESAKPGTDAYSKSAMDAFGVDGEPGECADDDLEDMSTYCVQADGTYAKAELAAPEPVRPKISWHARKKGRGGQVWGEVAMHQWGRSGNPHQS